MIVSRSGHGVRATVTLADSSYHRLSTDRCRSRRYAASASTSSIATRGRSESRAAAGVAEAPDGNEGADADGDIGSAAARVAGARDAARVASGWVARFGSGA